MDGILKKFLKNQYYIAINIHFHHAFIDRLLMAQLAGAAEYTDSNSAVG